MGLTLKKQLFNKMSQNVLKLALIIRFFISFKSTLRMKNMLS